MRGGVGEKCRPLPSGLPPLLLLALLVVEVALPTSPAIAAPCMWQKGYRLSGLAELNARGLSVKNEIDKNTSYFLEEGGGLSLSGHLWRPWLINGEVHGEAFRGDDFGDIGSIDHHRFTLGGEVTLLPCSILPASFFASRQTSGVDNRGLPGQNYDTTTYGIDTRLLIPQLPRLFVTISQRDFDRMIFPVPLALFGNSQGQTFEGRERSLSAAMVESAKGGSVTARYDLVERTDLTAATVANATPNSAKSLSQDFSIRGRMSLTETADWSVHVFGRVASFDQNISRTDINTFDIYSHISSHPDEKWDRRLTYRFHSDEGADTRNNLLQGYLHWRPEDWWGLSAEAVIDRTESPLGSPYRAIAISNATIGGEIRGEFGDWQAQAEERITAGGTKLTGIPGAKSGAPDSGGFVGHTFASVASTPVARGQTLFFRGNVANQTDRSEIGGDNSSYRFETDWNVQPNPFFGVNSIVSVGHTRMRDRRFAGSKQRQTNLRAQGDVRTRFFRMLGADMSVGYQVADSSRVTTLTHTLSTSGRLSLWFSQSLSLVGSMSWFFTSEMGEKRNQLNPRMELAAFYREIQLSASYDFSYTDERGQVTKTHEFLLKLTRRFDRVF